MISVTTFVNTLCSYASLLLSPALNLPTPWASWPPKSPFYPHGTIPFLTHFLSFPLSSKSLVSHNPPSWLSF